MTRLFGEEERFTPPDEPFVSSLAKTQSLLSTVVDSVSAISGEWIQSETDFVVLGPEPLILNRYYTGDYAHTTKLGYNWDFSRPRHLMIDIKGKGTRHAKIQARLHHTSGIATVHAATTSAEKLEKTIIPLPLSRTQGLTNCRGEISAKTNLHNTLIELDCKGKRCAVVSGNGDLTYYEFSHQQNFSTWKQGKIGVGEDENYVLNHYRPLYERKPNGNMIHFDNGIISAADASKSQIYGTLEFHNEGAKSLIVEASDGKKGTYQFGLCDYTESDASKIKICKNQRCYLTEASFSHKPTETYEYTCRPARMQHDNPEKPLLKVKKLPDGRFQEVEYYHKGKNRLEMDSEGKKIHLVEVDHSDDFRCNRVKVIKAPVGYDKKAIITHRFIYEANGKRVKKSDSFSGRTKVYDAYSRKTVYEYNPEHRPLKIQRYDRNNQLYSEECFTWDDRYAYRSELPSQEPLTSILPSSEDLFKACLKAKLLQTGGAGNLIGKYGKDDVGNILYAHFFKYDDKGNITQDRLYGNLSGIQQQCIELDAHDKPKKNSCEYYEKRFTYSDDAFNLLKTEEEDNGKGILYDYYPETDLVAAKYVTESGVICLRQFFHYDATGTLIKIVKDDGNKKGEVDLSGVTEKHITYIHPRKMAPMGLPDCVEHKYLDLQTHTENLLKKICYHYSREGHVEQQDHFDADDQWCYSLYWSYDAHGNVIREVNALGHEIIKDYDDNDNLSLEIGPRPGDRKEYTYDFSDRLISVKTDSDGKSWSTYNKYDLVGNRIAEIDRYGNETQYEYDDFNRLVRTLYPAMAGQIERPSTQIMYDHLDQPVQEIDAGGFATIKTYNVRGKVTSILHPNGELERFEYFLDGNIAKKVASNGTTTHLTLDCFGRILTEKVYSAKGDMLYETSHTYNSFHKTSTTDAMGVTTYFKYDDAGRLIQTTCLDKVEMYEYDALGRLAKKKEPFNTTQMKVTCTDYDLLDRIVEERIEDEKGSVLKKVSYEYDLLGQRTHVIEETAAGISQHVTFYDIDKKPIQTIDPDGNETHIIYDTIKNQLGQRVLQVHTTDPMGGQTIVTYDAMERPVKIEKRDLNGILLAHQELLYDMRGLLSRLIDHVVIQGKEIRSIESLFEYEVRGQLTRWIQANKLPEQQITHTEYNCYGQKEKLIKNDGITISYTYDPLGRLETCTSSDRSIDYFYQYNKRHQMIDVEDRNQHQHSLFEYDTRGRLERETLVTGLSTTYGYDELDRVISLTLPDKSQMMYIYDAMNLKEIKRFKNQKIIYTHRYDDFDLAGLPLQATTIYQQAQTSSYNLQKQPIAFENGSFKQHEAQYDALGQLRGYDWRDQVGKMQMRFGYDDLGHLISEQGHIKHLYSYDSLHNRITKNKILHQSNGLHQLMNAGDYTFAYDLSGNLKSKQKGKETTTYGYDALDRLISVKVGNKIIASYSYDALNRRVAKGIDRKTVRYLYVGQDEIGATDEGGQLQELRVLGQGIGAEMGASVAIELKGKVFAPTHDFQGNIVALSDKSGVTECYRYTAFGEASCYNSKGEKIATSQVGNPWRFASKRLDEESGLIYFGRRYYDPMHGRWITADPAGLNDGSNLYAYLHQSPLRALDRYGLQEEEPYYPLQDVDHDRSDLSKNEDPNANLDAPPGFVIKKKPTKNDRFYFYGSHQKGNMYFVYMGGMNTRFKDVCRAAKRFSEQLGDQFVLIIDNRSTGHFIADTLRCCFESVFHMETEAVKNMRTGVSTLFNAIDPKAFVCLRVHSEGALISKIAFEKVASEFRQRVFYDAYCPAAYMPDECVYQARYYRSKRDFVPLIDVRGVWRCRSSTTIFNPHPDAPFFDHGIDSPTFKKPQIENAAFYLQCVGSLCIQGG